MTTIQIQKIEKMAAESVSIARQALRKSNDLGAYLSLIEYHTGNASEHRSVKDFFEKLKS